MPNVSRLLNELRRRNVFNAGAAYIAGGWVFYQIADALLPLVGAPGWVARSIIVLLAIGLPFLLAFAWAFEITSEGLKRTEDVDPAASQTRETGRKIQYLIAGLLAVAVVFLVTDRFTGASPHPGERESLEVSASLPTATAENAVAVMPFRTSGPDTEIWREGLMDMLTTNLDGMGRLQAVSTRTVLARLRETGQTDPDLSTTLRAARQAGASVAVVGKVISTGETVRLSASLYDTETGSVNGRVQVEGAADDLLSLVDRMTVQTVASARTESGPGGGALPVPNLSALTTESLPALRAYLRGEDLFRQSRYQDALAQFDQAGQLDSTFAMADLRYAITLTHVQAATENMLQQMQGRVRRAQRHGNRLPTRETSLLDGMSVFILDGDAEKSVERLQEGLREHPADPELLYEYGYTLWGQPNVRPGALEEGLTFMRRAIQLDSSLTFAYQPIISTQISRGDTAEARDLLAAYAARDGEGDDSGVFASLKGALDVAYGDSTARARALQQVRDGVLPIGGYMLYEALRTEPTADALQAQVAVGSILAEKNGNYFSQATGLFFSGRYAELRSFIRDTTKSSRPEKDARLWTASLLLGRGQVRADEIPQGLLQNSCSMDQSEVLVFKICFNQARLLNIMKHRGEQTGIPLQEKIDEARAGLANSIDQATETGNGPLSALSEGYLALLDGEKLLAENDIRGARQIQDTYRSMLFIRDLGWEPLAVSVRAQIRAGQAAAALPYAEMITVQDPYGYYLAGRAHEAMGDETAARKSYERFVRAWRDADPDIPALQYATAFVKGEAPGAAPAL